MPLVSVAMGQDVRNQALSYLKGTKRLPAHFFSISYLFNFNPGRVVVEEVLEDLTSLMHGWLHMIIVARPLALSRQVSNSPYVRVLDSCMEANASVLPTYHRQCRSVWSIY